MHSAPTAAWRTQADRPHTSTQLASRRGQTVGLFSRTIISKAEAAQAAADEAAAKAEAERKEADAAAEAATAAAAQAKADKEAAEAAAAAAKESLAAAEAAVAEATQVLASLQKASESGAKGTFWWMERELEEARKYMPKSKFRALKKKMKKQKAAME